MIQNILKINLSTVSNLDSMTNRKVSEFLLGPMEDQGEKKTQQNNM